MGGRKLDHANLASVYTSGTSYNFELLGALAHSQITTTPNIGTGGKGTPVVQL